MSTARGEDAPTSESMRKRALAAQLAYAAVAVVSAEVDKLEKEPEPDVEEWGEERCESVFVFSDGHTAIPCYLTTCHEGKHHGWSVLVGGETTWD